MRAGCFSRLPTVRVPLTDKVIRVQDHLGRACHYAYTNHNLISFTDLEANMIHYEYLDGQSVTQLNHNLARVIDPEGYAFPSTTTTAPPGGGHA